MSEHSPGRLIGSRNGSNSFDAGTDGSATTLSIRKHARPALVTGLKGPRPIRKVGFAPTVEFFTDSIELSSFNGSRRPPDSPLALSSPIASPVSPERSPPSLDVVDATLSPTLRRRRVARARDSVDRAPSGPLPSVPFETYRDQILGMLAEKRWVLREAELRHRVAAGGGTVALYSTIGIALAIAVEVPLTLLVANMPLALLIVLPPVIWIFASTWGALIEYGRIKQSSSSVSIDRASAKALTINLCRLVTDLDSMQQRSATRKLLLEEALFTLGQATHLVSIYTGAEYMHRLAMSMLFGPFYLMLHLFMSHRVHPGASRAEAAWLFGGDERRRFVHMLAEGIGPWSDLHLQPQVQASLLEAAEPASDAPTSPPPRQRLEHAEV